LTAALSHSLSRYDAQGPILGATMGLQRLRVGPVHGPMMLGVLAAALLIAALVVTAARKS
jgi:hypothetical protein